MFINRRVWPYDDDEAHPGDGLIVMDRLPSPMNPYARPPAERIQRSADEPLPGIPKDARFDAADFPLDDPPVNDIVIEHSDRT